MKLILNCPRALAITCLSHQGQNSVHRTPFKVLPSRKQVCRSSKKNQLAVERRKPAMVVAKHSKFNSPEAISLQTKRMLLKRGMGNGEWGMGNGKLKMGNGKLKMGN